MIRYRNPPLTPRQDEGSFWTDAVATQHVPRDPKSIITAGGEIIITRQSSGVLQFNPVLPNLPSPVTRIEVEDLKATIRDLEAELSDLKRRLDELEQSQEEEVVVLRTITREDAKAEILRLFDEGGTWNYSDVARHIGINLEMAVELCEELISEGKVMEK